MSIQTGETAEAYVYYRLLTWGYDVHFASGIGRSFDLIVFHSGKAIKVQVKGTTHKEVNKNTYQFMTCKGNGKKRVYESNDCDVMALVSLTDERAFFIDRPTGIKTRISPSKFTPETERITWEKCLDRSIA